jgi:hypothetical protein
MLDPQRLPYEQPLPSRAALAWLLCTTLSACAAAVSGGIAGATRASEHTPGISLSVGAPTFRGNTGSFGLRVTTAVDHGLALRSGAIYGGYALNLLPGALVLEPALELGVGRPAAISIGGLGAYAGAATQLRVPLIGTSETEPVFNVYALTGDLLLSARAGGWMPPEAAKDKRLSWEWSIELGLRFSLGSDLMTRAQGEQADTQSSQPRDDGAAP